MKRIFLETERCNLKYINQDDFEELKIMLQNTDVMYAWEYLFSDEDVQHWIDENISRYNEYGLGYFIIENKLTGEICGQAALMSDMIDGILYYEVGYILKKEFWHKGLATECAFALVNYAFHNLNLSEVIFEIRPDNVNSRKVAERLKAKVVGEFTKNVRGKKMIHLIYKLSEKGL